VSAILRGSPARPCSRQAAFSFSARSGKRSGALACPGARDPVEHLVEALAAGLRRHSRCLVVVVPRAESDAEREPPLGDRVHGGRLFGDERRVLAPRHQQDRRHEADALCHGGRRAQRHERLVVGVDEPVERAERREAGGVGAARPVEDLSALDPGDRRRKSDANLHSE
jgi:hypothetical protein